MNTVFQREFFLSRSIQVVSFWLLSVSLIFTVESPAFAALKEFQPGGGGDMNSCLVPLLLRGLGNGLTREDKTGVLIENVPNRPFLSGEEPFDPARAAIDRFTRGEAPLEFTVGRLSSQSANDDILRFLERGWSVLDHYRNEQTGEPQIHTTSYFVENSGTVPASLLILLSVLPLTKTDRMERRAFFGLVFRPLRLVSALGIAAGRGRASFCGRHSASDWKANNGFFGVRVGSKRSP